MLSDQLARELAVYTLTSSSMVLSGLLGYFMAVWRKPWILRALLVVAVCSPLLVIGAVEIFLVCIVQIWLIGWLISMLRAFGIGSADGMDKRASVNRFSIGLLLCLTSVSAGAVALWQVLPTLNVTAWVSLVACSAATISISVSAWLLVNLAWRWYWRLPFALAIAMAFTALPACLDWFVLSLYSETVFWPPEPTAIIVINSPVDGFGIEWYPIGALVTLYLAMVLSLVKLGKRRNSIYFFSAVLVFLALLMPSWTLMKLLTPPQVVSLETDDNAYPAVLELGERIAKSQSALQEIHGELDELRELLKRPIAVPIDFTMENMPMDEISKNRDTAKAVGAYGDSQIAAGEFAKARDAYLLEISFGAKIRRGGLLIQMLVGVACSGGGIDPLYRHRQSCSAEQSKTIVTTLLNVSEQLEPGEAFVERDKIWSIQQGWHPHLQHLMVDFLGAKLTYIHQFMPHVRRELTQLRLLATEYAISRYLEEQGTLPKTLDDLVPTYLPKKLEDPFSSKAQPLQYKLGDANFILYSVGPNGVDDGGLAPQSYSDITLLGENCDLSLEHLSKLLADELKASESLEAAAEELGPETEGEAPMDRDEP